MEILNLRESGTQDVYIINGYYTCDSNDENYADVLQWIADEKEVMPALTPTEISEIATIDKWNQLNSEWEILTVTTSAGHTFAANEKAMKFMTFKANNMGDLVSFLWVEDWGSFQTNIVELKEALNLAADAQQNLIQTIFGV